MNREKFLAITHDMEFNGYAYFNNKAFLNKTNEVCYIPENAENESDFYTYKDLEEIASNWIEETGIKIENLVQKMYDNLTWEFPETYLNELTENE